jgi:hypothetical protein
MKGAVLGMLVAASSAAAGSPPARSLPFAGGEHLRYVIRYGIIHAGFSTLNVDEGPVIKGHRTWKITSQAWSNKVMDVLYNVRDRNESWMDREGLYSHHFEQDLHEGSYAAKRWIDYNYGAQQFVRIEERGGKQTRIEGTLPGPVQDVFSSLYYARTLPLEPGKSYEFLTNSDGKNWTLKINVLRRETVNVKAGKFSCVVVEPMMLSEGIFKNKGRLLVWLTDDDKRIPVLIRTQVSVGSVSAELTEREGN